MTTRTGNKVVLAAASVATLLMVVQDAQAGRWFRTRRAAYNGYSHSYHHSGHGYGHGHHYGYGQNGCCSPCANPCDPCGGVTDQGYGMAPGQSGSYEYSAGRPTYDDQYAPTPRDEEIPQQQQQRSRGESDAHSDNQQLNDQQLRSEQRNRELELQNAERENAHRDAERDARRIEQDAQRDADRTLQDAKRNAREIENRAEAIQTPASDPAEPVTPQP